jgi:pimeloyl-ACP methyl ester carboxylesterase
MHASFSAKLAALHFSTDRIAQEIKMSRFVLVHGAFCGAWIWGPLGERLKSKGHSVEAFDLPGLGEDRTPVKEITLDACTDRLCAVLASHPDPAIIIGHSMGGIIATQGAARCPERVAALVYVAAFLPRNGQSLLDLTKLPEGAGDQVQANIVLEGEPPVALMPAAVSRYALYDCCPPEIAAWAVKKQRPQPVVPFVAPVSIPPGALDGIDRYYVLCTQDHAVPPALQRRMISENPCTEVAELSTDHTPQLSRSEELAKVLDRFAMRASAHRQKQPAI